MLQYDIHHHPRLENDRGCFLFLSGLSQDTGYYALADPVSGFPKLNLYEFLPSPRSAFWTTSAGRFRLCSYLSRPMTSLPTLLNLMQMHTPSFIAQFEKGHLKVGGDLLHAYVGLSVRAVKDKDSTED